MGLVRIVLDPPADYTLLDAAMERLGFSLRIPAIVEDREVEYALPRGSYWRADLNATELLEQARLALQAADELGWQATATEGDTNFEGLPVVGSTG